VWYSRNLSIFRQQWFEYWTFFCDKLLVLLAFLVTQLQIFVTLTSLLLRIVTFIQYLITFSQIWIILSRFKRNSVILLKTRNPRVWHRIEFLIAWGENLVAWDCGKKKLKFQQKIVKNISMQIVPKPYILPLKTSYDFQKEIVFCVLSDLFLKWYWVRLPKFALIIISS